MRKFSHRNRIHKLRRKFCLIHIKANADDTGFNHAPGSQYILYQHPANLPVADINIVWPLDVWPESVAIQQLLDSQCRNNAYIKLFFSRNLPDSVLARTQQHRESQVLSAATAPLVSALPFACCLV